jgi:FHA domain
MAATFCALASAAQFLGIESFVASLWAAITSALATSFGHEPQFMLAAAMLAGLLPVVSLAALVSRFGLRFWSARNVSAAEQPSRTKATIWPPLAQARGTQPVLQVVGEGAASHPIGSQMVRIGRHEENDIRLASPTVHRYHAVLHRTTDRAYVITDLSGAQGNGVVVNAKRVDEVELAAGDTIELGEVKLRFGFADAP